MHSHLRSQDHSSATSNSKGFQSRSFTEETESADQDVPAQDSTSLQAKRENTSRLDHHLKNISIFPSKSTALQTKLTVGAPDDQYEQEADYVAEQVMNMPAPTASIQREAAEEKDLQRRPLDRFITPLVQRQKLSEEDESVQTKLVGVPAIQREEMQAAVEPVQMKLFLQRAAEDDATVSDNLQNQLSQSQGSGQALSSEVRAFMETRFETDFSGVRVHTDAAAVQMNRELGAQAFTHGSDIYYGGGKTPGKDALTAHELTHVVQQSGAVQRQPVKGGSGTILRSPTDALPAIAPAAPPGAKILLPGVSTPDKIAVQLGDDYDFEQEPAAGDTSESLLGLSYGLKRLESLWIRDMYTAMQILKVNGSSKSRSQKPYQWLLNNRANAAPRTQTVLKSIAAPDSLVEADFAGIPADQVTEIKAFVKLKQWDDSVSGLPRVSKPGTGAGDAVSQSVMVDYIRRRRDAAASKDNLKKARGGYVYYGDSSKDPAPSSTGTDLQKEVWKELDGEGGATAINTYDDQILTWGKGWSAKSTLPGIADSFLKADPEAKQELMEAGFTYNGNWLYVDVDSGKVLEGEAALRGLQNDKKFLSLLAHLSEEPTHRQNLVNAQFDYVKSGGHAADIPADIVSLWPGTWSTESVRFAAHCVHWGYSWGQAKSHGPALHDLLKWISGLKGTSSNSAVLVKGWSSHTIRSFANYAAQKLMTAPAPLPDPLVAGTYYFTADNDTTKAWTWKP